MRRETHHNRLPERHQASLDSRRVQGRRCYSDKGPSKPNTVLIHNSFFLNKPVRQRHYLMGQETLQSPSNSTVAQIYPPKPCFPSRTTAPLPQLHDALSIRSQDQYVIVFRSRTRLAGRKAKIIVEQKRDERALDDVGSEEATGAGVGAVAEFERVRTEGRKRKVSQRALLPMHGNAAYGGAWGTRDTEGGSPGCYAQILGFVAGLSPEFRPAETIKAPGEGSRIGFRVHGWDADVGAGGEYGAVFERQGRHHFAVYGYWEGSTGSVNRKRPRMVGRQPDRAGSLRRFWETCRWDSLRKLSILTSLASDRGLSSRAPPSSRMMPSSSARNGLTYSGRPARSNSACITLWFDEYGSDIYWVRGLHIQPFPYSVFPQYSIE